MIRFFLQEVRVRTTEMSVNDFNMEEVPAHAGDSTPGQDGAPPSIAKRARPSSPLAGSSGSQSVPRAAVASPHLS